uniref:Reverse transcriptase domain-containing protein n=1 Tax=Tanacetum cinerariifolium TaxID=118510 RepID=A0A699ICH6_TANCI|nr:hypothetical protein [Tanacetum cinerariifolium]
METDKISERYIAPYFVNGLESYDERKKLVKKELIVALKGELYFVKFIINLDEDDSEPGFILGRSFLRLALEVVDFGYWTIFISWESFNSEEVEIEALAVKISQKFALLEEERHEKDDPGAFIFPTRLEGKVNKNALADTGLDINIMPYRIYEMLGREEMKKIDRGITMINHTQAKAMRKLSNVLFQVGVTTIIAKFLILDITIDRDAPIVVGRGFLYTIGVPRVGIPRPPRASMQDLYDRMGRMEIRQEAIKHIEYRQSYHWDMYHEVCEHMAGVYSVPLQGAYNPPGYAQP